VDNDIVAKVKLDRPDDDQFQYRWLGFEMLTKSAALTEMLLKAISTLIADEQSAAIVLMIAVGARTKRTGKKSPSSSVQKVLELCGDKTIKPTKDEREQLEDLRELGENNRIRFNSDEALQEIRFGIDRVQKGTYPFFNRNLPLNEYYRWENKDRKKGLPMLECMFNDLIDERQLDPLSMSREPMESLFRAWDWPEHLHPKTRKDVEELVVEHREELALPGMTDKQIELEVIARYFDSHVRVIEYSQLHKEVVVQIYGAIPCAFDFPDDRVDQDLRVIHLLHHKDNSWCSFVDPRVADHINNALPKTIANQFVMGKRLQRMRQERGRTIKIQEE
jgi:hypothetical protein